MELKRNTKLQNGKYTIHKKIGEGGFGITYKGIWKYDVSNPLGKTTIDFPVAIKEFMFPEYCTRDEYSDNLIISSKNGNELFYRFKEKLKKEGNILINLNHPNIVNVSEVFEENQTAYLVMEFIDGDNLGDLIFREGTLSVSATLKHMKQIASALQYIHEQGIIHLDVKPSNILIDKNGDAKLIDFGIAKQYTSTEQKQSTTVATFSKGYSPIEQYAANRKDRYNARTDIYSFGATFYHCLTGEVPLEAAVRLSDKLIPPAEINPNIPDFLDKALLKAMEMKQTDRYHSVTELLEALDVPLEFDTEDEPVKTEFTAPEPFPAEGTDSFTDHEYIAPAKSRQQLRRILSVFAAVTIVGLFVFILTLGFSGNDRVVIIKPPDTTQPHVVQPEVTPEVILPVVAPPDTPVISRPPQQQPDTQAVRNTQTRQTTTPVTGNTQPRPAQTPAQQPASATAEPEETLHSGSLAIQGNVYSGDIKNKKPHGNGRISYKSSSLVSPFDIKQTKAEPGDYLIGKWINGELERGVLYDAEGKTKGTLIIGRF